MSGFSDKLRQMLDDRGVSQNALAQRAEIDRTTLNKVLRGNRLPNSAFFEKLCDALALSPAQITELEELIEIEKVGADVYHQRQLVKQLIEQVASIDVPVTDSPLAEKSVTLPKAITEKDVVIYHGAFVVNNLIKDLAEDEFYNVEKPMVRILCPIEYSYLFSVLFQLFSLDPNRMCIRHIVRAETRRGKGTQRNLERLKQLLPFALTSGVGYSAHYYFSDYEQFSDVGLPTPYCVIFSRYVVLLSKRYDTAIVIGTPEGVSFYQQEFDRMLATCHPLATRFMSPVEAIAYENEMGYGGDHPFRVLVPEPALCYVFPHEQIIDHRRREIPGIEQLADMLRTRYQKIYDRGNAFSAQYFSESGLWRLVKTGFSCEFPPELVHPFTLEERLFYVEEYIRRIEGGHMCRAVNSAKFVVPVTCSANYIENSSVNFSLFSAGTNNLRAVIITEEGVIDAFDDFIENLPKTDLARTKEDTLAIFEEAAENLRRQIAGQKG